MPNGGGLLRNLIGKIPGLQGMSDASASGGPSNGQAGGKKPSFMGTLTRGLQQHKAQQVKRNGQQNGWYGTD
jgi:hypothetical protein